MTRIRAIIFQLTWFIWTVILVILATPTLAMPPRYLRAFASTWGRHTNFLLKWIMGVTVEVRGLNNMPEEPVIVASKHQSLWETIFFLGALKRPAFILKKELLRIPVYGVMCQKLGMVTVDREGQASALREMVADARAALDEGRPIVIFPQGTRTPPGSATDEKPYRPGIAALYRTLGCRVVPVALNSGSCWPKPWFRQRPGRIIVQFLPPITAGLARKSFMQQLEGSIEPAVKELEQSALAQ